MNKNVDSDLRLKALIFDVDGTLADTESAHLAAFNHAFAEQGLDWHWDVARTQACWRFLAAKSACCTIGIMRILI
jgi:beta-phosphoglucomutase-like phosphatase (HAD superfamily)